MSMDYNRFHIAVEFKNQKAAYAQFTLINEIDVKLVGNRNLLADVANMEELLAALPYGFQPDCFDGGCIWDIWEAEEEEEEITDFEDLVREGDFSQIASVVLVADHDGEPWGLEWEKYTLSPYDVTSGRIKRQWNGSKRESVPRGEDYIFETLLPGVKKCIFSGWNNEPKEELPKAVRSTTALGGSFDKEFEYTLREEDEDVFIITFPRGIYITAYKGTDPVPVVPETVDGYPVIAVNSFGSNAYVTDAVIPQGIKVYDNSFKDCPNIRAKNGFTIVAGYLMSYTGNVSQVIIPEGVHTILSDVFKNNDSVQTVILPESIRHIESCTFEECKNLQSINFPEGLREIEFHAFQNTALTEVSFPKSLGKIGEHAFCRCESLEKIQIFPNTVCESGAFSGYKNIEKLSRDDGIVLVNGTMFSIDIWKHKKYIHCPDGEIRVRIPADVIRIDGDFCFNAPGNILDEMTITDAMEYINSSDFFLSGIEKFRIVSAETGELLWETDRFASCSNLLTDFEPFEDFCERLEEDGIAAVINSPIKQKRKPAAKKNPQPTQKPELKDDLHNREKIVAEEESQRAESAKQWMAEYGQYIEVSPEIDFNGTLFVFSGLSLHANEKDHPIVQQVIAKGGQYRAKVSGLTNYLVVDPGMAGGSKVKNAIEQKNKGKNVRIILLEDLENALNGKPVSKKKTSQTMPPKKPAEKKTTATKDPAKASQIAKQPQRTTVKAVKVSKSDCDIDSAGYLSGYFGLETDIILPDGVTSIFGEAFSNNDKLKTVVIPEGVKSVEWNAFAFCSKLTNVLLPNTLQAIEWKAFLFCESLTTIIIPDGCREIGFDAFSGCKNLRDIYVPKSVYDIGADAFQTYNSETVVHAPKGSEAEKYAVENGMKHDNKKPNILFVPEDQSGGIHERMLPEVIRGDYVFRGDELVRYVGTMPHTVIPTGVTKLPKRLFYFKPVETVQIPNGVQSVGDSAFQMCTQLRELKLPPSVQEIGSFAFDGAGLEKLHLPAGLKALPSFLCNGCKKLQFLDVPEGVEKIGLCALDGCPSLKTLILPDSLKEIEQLLGKAMEESTELLVVCSKGSAGEKFARKKKIPYYIRKPGEPLPKDLWIRDGIVLRYGGYDKELTLPEGTKTITEKAFKGNTILGKLQIPASVKTIEDGAFSGCLGSLQLCVAEGSAAWQYAKDNRMNFFCGTLEEAKAYEQEQKRIAEAEARHKAKVMNYNQACARFSSASIASDYISIVALLDRAEDYADAKAKRQIAGKLREKAGKLLAETSAIKNKEKEITATELALAGLNFLQFGKKKELKAKLEVLQAELKVLQINTEEIRQDIETLRQQW